MNSKIKRLTALILVLAMVATYIPVSVFAAWTATVNYDLKGGNVNGATTLAPTTGSGSGFSTTVKLRSDVPTKDGYKFLGWKGVDTYQPGDEYTVTSVARTVKLEAQWGAIYTVKFLPGTGGIGTAMADVKAGPDDTFNLPLNTYTRAGYHFDKWKSNVTNVLDKPYTYSDGESVKNIHQSPIHSDKSVVELTAQWEANSYTVTLDANGGTFLALYGGGETYSYSVKYDDKYGVNLAKTDLGSYTIGICLRGDKFDFDGWYTEKTGGTKVHTDTVNTRAENHTLYAHWTAKTYTVKFSGGDADGGTAMQDMEVSRGSSFTLPANTYTYTGHHFVGWKSSVNNNTYSDTQSGLSNINDIAGVPVSDTVTLTAQWEIDTFDVTYGASKVTYDYGTVISIDPGIGTYEGNSTTFLKTITAAYTFTDPTTTADYSFDYWSRTDNFFTATWHKNHPELTYYDKDTAKEETVAFDYNTNITLALGGGSYDGGTYFGITDDTEIGTPTRKGYTFKGWTRDNATLTAVWDAISYTISYDLNNGDSNDPANPSSYTVENTTFSLKDASRTGYSFLGWTDKDVDLDIIPHSVTIENGSVGNRRFKAHWLVQSYKVTLDVNASDAKMKNDYGGGKTYTYDVVFDAPYGLPVSNIKIGTFASSTCERDGWTFTGWYTTPDDTTEKGTQIFSDTIVKIGKNHTLYARWSQLAYTVNFKANAEGVTNTMDSQSIARNDTVSLKANAFTRPGYEFLGWALSADGIVVYTDEAQVRNIAAANGSIDLYAKWIACTTQVKLNTNGGSFQPSGNTTATILVTYDKTYGDANLGGYSTFIARTGYNFTGWYNDDEDESGDGIKKYTTGTAVEVTPATELWAHWEPITYKIKLDPGIGTGSAYTVDAEYTYDKEFAIPACPESFSLEGYVFNGWKTVLNKDLTAGASAKHNLTVIDDDTVILYAQWKAADDTKYTVEYYVEGLDGKYPTEPSYVDKTKTGTTATNTNASSLNAAMLQGFVSDFFTELGFSNLPILGNGKTVVKLYYERKLSGVSYKGSILPDTVRYGATVTLNLNDSEKHKATFTHSAENGGTYTATDNSKTMLINAKSITIEDPTRVGYKFLGWTKNPVGYAGDFTLTGQWLLEKYDVNYSEYASSNTTAPASTAHSTDFATVIVINPNFGTYSGTLLEFAVDVNGTTIPNPTRTGYTFLGWEKIDNVEDLGFTLKAQWLINKYDVTYSEYASSNTTAPASTAHPTDYGTVIVINPNFGIYSGTLLEFAIDVNGTTIPNPTRAGYIFLGWEKIDNIVDLGYTLKAQWLARTDTDYSIEYLLQDLDGIPKWAFTKTFHDGETGTTTDAADYPLSMWYNDGDGINDLHSIDLTDYDTANPVIVNVTILGTGESVAYVKYNRKVCTANYAGAVTLYDSVFYGATITLDLNDDDQVLNKGEQPDLASYENEEGNGGVFDAAKLTYYINSSTVKISNPTRDGYTFAHWVKTPIGTCGNFTLTAQWTANENTKYKVEYFLMGLDGKYQKESNYTGHHTGTTATLIDPPKLTNEKCADYIPAYFTLQEFDKLHLCGTGKTLFMLYYARNIGTLTYDNGGVQDVSSDIYYGATVTLDLNDTDVADSPAAYDHGANNGIFDSEALTIEINAKTVTVNDPTRSGYTFDGWEVNPTGTKGDITLTAQWTVNNYEVRFNANTDDYNLTGEMSNEGFTFDVSKKLTAVGFTRTGYDFGGWATSADGDAVYTDNQSVMNLSAVDGDVIDLYAIWLPIHYSIVFEANLTDYTGETASISDIAYDEQVKLTANGFVGTKNETFLGWNTDANGTGTSFADELDVKALTSVDGATVTLYAQWQQAEKFSISGYVYTDMFSAGDKGPSGAILTLKKLGGSIEFGGKADEKDSGNGKTIPNGYFAYRFTNLEPGTYQLTATRKLGNGSDKTVTKEIVITASNAVQENVLLNSFQISSVVIPLAEVPTVTDNIQKAAETRKEYLEQLSGTPISSYEMRLYVENIDSDNDQQAEDVEKTEKFVDKLIGGDYTAQYISITLAESVNGAAETGLSDSLELIKNTIAFDFNSIEPGTTVHIVRVHNGSNPEEIGEDPNGEGEHIVLNKQNGTIEIYARFYSTYALVYKKAKPAPIIVRPNPNTGVVLAAVVDTAAPANELAVDLPRKREW